jgi:hypothetical protein
MKKYWLALFTVITLFACNNEPETTESSPNLTNVQNVNGNMPDTSSSITLDNKQATDSLSIADSSNKKP